MRIRPRSSDLEFQKTAPVKSETRHQPAHAGSWDMLERIRTTLAFSDEEWQSMTRLPHAELTRLRETHADLPSASLETLAEALDLDPERILAGQVDVKTLLAHRRGNICRIPTRYRKGAQSRIRTSVHLLDFVELHHGWRARQLILNRFQVTDSLFLSLDNQINILFLSDICGYLHECNISLERLQRMGMHSSIANYHSPLGDLFRQYNDPVEMWQAAVLDIGHKYYDRNFIYRIESLSRDELRLSAEPNPEVQDALRTHILGRVEVCASKAGLISAFTTYIGFSSAPIRETRCIHRGDASCLFVLDLRTVYASRRPN